LDGAATGAFRNRRWLRNLERHGFFRIAIPLYLIICASADALKPDGDIHDGINNV
jgi:hypothetical protein